MGLLSVGTPLPWKDAKPLADYVRFHGIEQLINIYNNYKDCKGYVLLWGDEVEYMVISYDDQNRVANLSLRQAQILEELAKFDTPGVLYHPEYGRYMLEATPSKPYRGTIEDICTVEANMKSRRVIARAHMLDNEVPLTVTSFPRLGVPGKFTEPYHEPNGPASRSLFLPDEIINPHPRFPTLTANIRERRGSKVAINVPLFFDTKTSPSPWIDPNIPFDRDLYPEDSNARDGAALPDHIYMDSMGFGMGCCCLQITFQATDIEEARNLYDQLAPLGPIMLALTAASPAYRGYLSDQDCRWNVIAGSVDDRTPEERGLEPLKNARFRIPKSRYDSIDSYISESPLMRPEYNDIPLVIDEKIRDRLLEADFPTPLANHFAHLFIRDPIVIFSDSLEQDDAVDTDHFENIQSTNWQTMRFKPPPSEPSHVNGNDSKKSSIGWRVEFRSMEVQFTDFENAAFSIFIVLVTRAILSFGLNFLVPISKVDENMNVAHRREAVLNEKFWFRKNVFTFNRTRPASPIHSPTPSISSGFSFVNTPVEDEYEYMSIDEIINGKATYCERCGGMSGMHGFPGLLALVQKYLDTMNVEIGIRSRLEVYLTLISKRASGELDTTATWIRKYVRSHPDYKFDSVVSDQINYDLMKTIEEITKEKGWDEPDVAGSLLGTIQEMRAKSSHESNGTSAQ
ncbi:hypothetical protein CANCADRAFT_29900 [Tortispora caseinolytica NRRL Y-17796]|uniref:Glutamate--cysteine ligase n=1 Tax=Tortispora caseinolytica NRRL Y-17796 TaxID=767744 RepID=A0A1E4TIH1_9ASCO|nr:hypothetical protein CANCADRAFT_29900 [Tortispora caseinolytica NRRL Y-17796]